MKSRAALLKRDTYALYLAYRHPRTPWYAKVFSALVVAYAFSPIDLIPDFIPLLGYLDDLLLIPLGVALALKMIPAEVMAECRTQAESRLGQDHPVSYFAAALIVALWLAVLFLIGRWVYGMIVK